MAERQRNRKRRLGRVERLKKTISLKSQKIELLCAANEGLNKSMKQLAAEKKVITRYVACR